MKKLTALLLALVMTLSLCACGESAELKSVREQIAAIGEVGLDSEAAIAAAEEAYRALSEEDKAKVDNYTELLAARETYDAAVQAAREASAAAERAAAQKALAGKWVDVYSKVQLYMSSSPLILNEDGSVVTDTLTYEWSLSDDGRSISLGYGGTALLLLNIVDEDGITALVNTFPNSSSNVYVREEDFQTFFDRRFVAVELSPENVGEYFGEFVRVGDWLDEFGDPIKDYGAYAFRSAAYERGLVYMGCSQDLAVEWTSKTRWGEDQSCLVSDPFTPQYLSEPVSFVSFGRVKGTLYYAKAEYVAENGLEPWEGQPYPFRVIRFTDGTCFGFNGWWQSAADYDDCKY